MNPQAHTRIEARLDAATADRLQAFATWQGMDQDEAVRHLLTAALRISDADALLDTLNRLSIERLFPEADGDPEAIYELLDNEVGASEHYAELADEIAWLMVTVKAARGHQILTVTRGAELNEHGRPARLDHAFTVLQDDAEATRAFAETITALTEEFWTEHLPVESMWIEFHHDLGLFLTLAESGAIPKAAINYEHTRTLTD